MAGTLQRIKYLRGLEVFSGLLLVPLFVIFAYSMMQALSSTSSQGLSTQSANSFIESTVIPFVTIMIVIFIAVYYLQITIANQREELAEKIIGYVTSNEETDLAVLGSLLDISETEASDIVAKLVTQDRLQGIRIDLSNFTITKEQNVVLSPAASNPLTNPDPVHSAASQTKTAQPLSSDDVIIKARLYELDQLKAQNKIGDTAYFKLREDLEKKLSQTEKGTQVYEDNSTSIPQER